MWGEIELGVEESLEKGRVTPAQQGQIGQGSKVNRFVIGAAEMSRGEAKGQEEEKAEDSDPNGAKRRARSRFRARARLNDFHAAHSTEPENREAKCTSCWLMFACPLPCSGSASRHLTSVWKVRHSASSVQYP